MENRNESFISKYRVFVLFVVLIAASAAILMLKPSEGTAYTASAQGFNGEVKVQVVIKDGVIKSVSVLEHTETEGIGTVAVEEVPAQIVTANGIEVDGVSTATYTTKAIKEAVADCMEQAGIEVTRP